jgi:Protein of unknown function (DUF3108)
MPDRSAAPSSRAVFTARRGRALALITVLVVTAHWVALRQAAPRLGIGDEADPLATAALETRTITPAPPPAPAAIAPAAPPPRAENRPKPVKKALDSASAQSKRASVAPEIIANPVPESLPEPAPQAPAEAPAATAAPPPVPEVASAAAAAAAQASAQPAPPQLSGMALPGSMQLLYKMTGSAQGLSYHASAQLDWNSTGDRYDSSMTVSALFLGSRSMASQGAIGPNGLAPARFADKTRKRELAAHFEPDKQQISFSNNAPSAPWMPGAQDRLSLFIQLAGMLAGDPAAFPLGSRISVYAAGPRSAEMMDFLVESEELLQLPSGEMITLKLASQVHNDYDRKLEIWYAPSLGFLPVRVKYTLANSDFIDQQLREIKKP